MKTNILCLLTSLMIFSLSGCSSMHMFSKNYDDCQTLYEFGEYYDYVNYCSVYSDNDIMTQWNLANIYRTNSVGLKNYQKTAYYTQLAASNGLPEAISQQCSDYINGTGGVRRDIERATWWCNKAAANGDEDAMAFLNQLYGRQIETARN